MEFYSNAVFLVGRLMKGTYFGSGTHQGTRVVSTEGVKCILLSPNAVSSNNLVCFANQVDIINSHQHLRFKCHWITILIVVSSDTMLPIYVCSNKNYSIKSTSVVLVSESVSRNSGISPSQVVMASWRNGSDHQNNKFISM